MAGTQDRVTGIGTIRWSHANTAVVSDSERPDGLPGPVRPRRPEDFDALYTGTPPWDIGRPQPAFVQLADAGVLRGHVLDVGCGTGEHALMAAALGLQAVGIDAAPGG